MHNVKIEYKINTVTKADIYKHLLVCNDRFIPSLNNKVDINAYADKLINKATIFEAWAENILIGCIAAYLNDVVTQVGFITNVSVLKEFEGHGVASKLLIMSINHAGINSINTIKLEVNKKNSIAVGLYSKFNFNIEHKTGDIITMRLIIK